MDYKKILYDLEDFAKKEYLKLGDEFQLTFREGNISMKSPFLEQELSQIHCKFTFNYNYFNISMWMGDSGGGWALTYKDIAYASADEELIQEVMKWRTTPFRVKNKTVKFS